MSYAILTGMDGKERWLSVAVGKILADRRQELGLKQDEVATSLRVKRSSISNIESGRQVLLIDVFYSLCKVLDISSASVLNEASKSEAAIKELGEIVDKY